MHIQNGCIPVIPENDGHCKVSIKIPGELGVFYVLKFIHTDSYLGSPRQNIISPLSNFIIWNKYASEF